MSIFFITNQNRGCSFVSRVAYSRRIKREGEKAGGGGERRVGLAQLL